MPLQIIVGTQWGDEGKGRIVDWFAANADVVARYNGGDNAGHSVTVGPKLFKLHLVPSGIIHSRPVAVLGNGMVINLRSLVDEIAMLRKAGIEINPTRLRISHAAHLITPAHQAIGWHATGTLGVFGAAASIYGTLITSFLAMLVAITFIDAFVSIDSNWRHGRPLTCRSKTEPLFAAAACCMLSRASVGMVLIVPVG